MTPTDVSSEIDNDHTANYTGEAKTECLVLCNGLGSLSKHKNQHNCGHSEISGFKVPTLNDRLAMLRNSERCSDRTRKDGISKEISLPLEVRLSGNKSKLLGTNLNHPQMVKVSVYTKAVNPYLVIYDSSRKYAKPAACLKLVNCEVHKGFPTAKGNCQNINDAEEDCAFRIVPNKNDDADSASVVTLRASCVEKRDEWVRFLTSVKNGTAGKSESTSSSYIPGSSVLPTLVEQEDNANDEGSSPADTLKVPSRRKAREGRRSSLNSLGIRLRCFNIGKCR